MKTRNLVNCIIPLIYNWTSNILPYDIKLLYWKFTQTLVLEIYMLHTKVIHSKENNTDNISWRWFLSVERQMYSIWLKFVSFPYVFKVCNILTCNSNKKLKIKTMYRVLWKRNFSSVEPFQWTFKLIKIYSIWEFIIFCSKIHCRMDSFVLLSTCQQTLCNITEM